MAAKRRTVGKVVGGFHKVGGFTPFKAPSKPPPGFFDPALEQQRRANARGYGDLSADTTLGNARAGEDLGITTADLQRQRDQSLADLMTRETRSRLAHDTATADLTRQYGILGSNQAQSANAAGLTLGGYMQQAAEKRAANQAHDQAPIDAALSQDLQDISTARDRVNQAYDQGVGAAGLDFTRGTQDRSTQLARAGRELAFGNQDITESEFAQAAQSGYVAPTKPRNEFTRRGVTYRRVRGGYMLPNGRILNHAQLLKAYH